MFTTFTMFTSSLSGEKRWRTVHNMFTMFTTITMFTSRLSGGKRENMKKKHQIPCLPRLPRLPCLPAVCRLKKADVQCTTCLPCLPLLPCLPADCRVTKEKTWRKKTPITLFTTFTTFTAFTMFTKISKNLYSASYRASYDRGVYVNVTSHETETVKLSFKILKF